jgi:hypothetical protein
MTFTYTVGSSPAPTPTTANGRLGYAWADQPTAADYSPNAAYAHNSGGGDISVTRTGVGAYTVTFAGLGGNGQAGGHVQVTPYGSGSKTAKVVNWMSVGADVTVNVRCYAADGSPADAKYSVLVVWR